MSSCIYHVVVVVLFVIWEWEATVEWVGSEGTVEKVKKEDWRAETRRNKAARPAEKAADKRKVPDNVGTVQVAVQRAAPLQAEERVAAEKVVLVKAVPVNAGSVNGVAAAGVETAGKVAGGRRPSGPNILSLLTRKNRQNITYQLRLGIVRTHI